MKHTSDSLYHDETIKGINDFNKNHGKVNEKITKYINLIATFKKHPGLSIENLNGNYIDLYKIIFSNPELLQKFKFNFSAALKNQKNELIKKVKYFKNAEDRLHYAFQPELEKQLAHYKKNTQLFLIIDKGITSIEASEVTIYGKLLKSHIKEELTAYLNCILKNLEKARNKLVENLKIETLENKPQINNFR